MKMKKRYSTPIFASLLWFSGVTLAQGAVNIQCDPDGNMNDNPNVKCMHLVAGDGFATMADGKTQYIFGFADVTGIAADTQAEKDALIAKGILANQWPAPSIVLEEGQEFYLNLTNVGMLIRPDLFDPHTVHFHGYPESSTVFDGLPESGIAINMGSTLTYYYKINDPGTYMYHCHVEATEHMQMGMLGSLYVKPQQDGTLHTFGGRDYTQFAYNDGDGSTGYDRDFPIQLGSFDSAFHDASETVQPLPFALMVDNYPMINGRGYPDTADARTTDFPATEGSSATPLNNPDHPQLQTSQPVSTRIEATQGERILLRISNLAITRYYTLQSSGIKMQVVGRDAKLLRAENNGPDLYYETNSVTLGGGESADVILDTGNVNPGTYVLYTSNLNYLSNDQDQFGGMMTEIIIN